MGAAMHPANANSPHRYFARWRNIRLGNIRLLINEIIAATRHDIIGSSSRPCIMRPMRFPQIPVILIVGWMAVCSGLSSTKPVEVLDERTGVTFGALKEPIELVPGTQNAVLILGKHTSFAYLGPVEWNRSGALSYSLWIHIAPGNDRQAGDIHASAAVTVILDDGPLALSPTTAPALG